MIATDPLSLFFIGCSALGLLYLLINAFLGHGIGHHASHIGHAAAPAPHIAHGTHVPHALHAHQGHNATHPTDQNTSQPTDQQGKTHHFSPLALFNPMSIALFLVGFGVCGYLLKNIASVALPYMFSGSVIGGLLIAIVLLMLLNRILVDDGAPTTLDVTDRTGLLGKVLMTIPEAGLGEVLYDSPGGTRKSVPARSIDGRRLERGQEIVVINYAAGIAEVDTWDNFIQQTETNSANTFENFD